MTSDSQHISVCICTFKRPGLLKRTLEGIARQRTDGKFGYSIVVADNDALQSASGTVSEFARTSPVPVKYCVEREQNIALARNTVVANAAGDLIAFIDDDEFPAEDWLLKLLSACEAHQAAGVLGPVKPFFEQPPPAWLVKGRFCERPEHPTGYVLDWRETRTGNVLFRRRILEAKEEPFRREFRNGGEDQEFFRRMMERGGIFIWCNEAVVHEIVPPERWKRRYLLRRALLRGQNERHLADLRGIIKSLIAVPLYGMALPFLLISGQHLFMRYLIKLLDHAGKLLAVVGLKPLGDRYLT